MNFNSRKVFKKAKNGKQHGKLYKRVNIVINYKSITYQ